jgi:hypothetical protein
MQTQSQPTPENPLRVDPLTYDLLNEIATTYRVLGLALDSVHVLAESATAGAITGTLDQAKAFEVLRQAQKDVLDAFAKLASGAAFEPAGKAH